MAHFQIIIAENDEDDRMLLEHAIEETKLAVKMHFVQDGNELMDYLYRKGKYAQLKRFQSIHLILLDLNMPKKNGLEVIKEVRENQKLRQIPIVVLSTSNTKEDIYLSYYIGANSFITKPSSFDSLVNTMKMLIEYWSQTVELPSKNIGDKNDRLLSQNTPN